MLQMLYKCNSISIRDKFFYDALLLKISQQMTKMVSAKDMVMFGASLSANPHLQTDQTELIKKFYSHVYQHRFLLTLQEKEVLKNIFEEMNIMKFYTKHLDLFLDMKRKEVAI